MKLKRSIFAPILGLVIFTDSHANVPADIIPSDSLSNGTQFLKEFTVTGKKVQIIERGMDYTISNIKGSDLADAGTLLDLILWSPGLTVDNNDNISVVGVAGSPLVYINGVKVTDRVKLTSLSSNMIKKIEVIRAPGAEYPVGTNSVLKITTTVPLKDILNLNLVDKAQQGHRFSNSIDGNAFGSIGNIDILASVGYKFGNSRQSSLATEMVIGKDGTPIRENKTYQKDLIHSSKWNWLAGVNWNLNSTATIQLEYSGSTTDQKRDFVSELTTLKSGKEEITDYVSRNNSGPVTHSLLGSYTQEFENSSLEFLGTYNLRNNDACEKIFLLPENILDQANKKKSSSDLWTLQGKYSWKFRKRDKQSVGAYGGRSNSDSNNDFSVTGLQNVNSSVDWTEFFYSGYWEVKGYGITTGLRGRWERQRSHSVVAEEGTKYDKNYFNVIPNLSIYHRFSKKLALNLYYKYRYTLPSFSQISPVVSLNDLIYYETGNPDLKIPRTHEFAMVFNLPKITLIGEFNKHVNSISDITTPIEGTDCFLVKPINASGSYNFQLTANYNLNLANKFRMYASGNIGYYNTKYFYLDALQKRTRLTAMVYLNGNYSLTKDFSLFMNGYYVSPQLVNNTQVGYNCNISFGANYKLLGSKLSLRLTVNDVLARSVTPWWKEYSPNLYRTRRNYYDTRRVILTVNYRFTMVRQNYSELDNADDFDRM